jgi:superfamily II DNA or RNA helicase
MSIIKIDKPKGSIYIRDNVWYNMENVIKMGISSFAKDRENTYNTSEFIPGEYLLVIEIPLDKMKPLDKFLKLYFKSYNIYKGGGTEFYSRDIIPLIEPYIQSLNIEYRVLSKEEIDNMERCERVRNIPNVNKIKEIFNKLNLKNLIQKLKNKKNANTNTNTNTNTNISNTITPNDVQQYILSIIEGFFTMYFIGKIIWACGLGKALLSILIIKKLNFKSIAFGVPSKNLQKQITNEILKIFPNKNNILFVGGDCTDDITSTTDKDQIISFINNKCNNEPKFVITTYHSCYLLVDRERDITFDFKVGDEAHHLVGVEREEEKGFRLFHKITSKKSLFMTATEKTIENRTNKVYSMDDETIFGKYIDIKSVHWAIENKKITDYNILVLKNTEDEVDDIVNSLRLNIYNKELFISCYMCLKSFEKYSDLTHLLLYTNTTENAELAKKYIDEILTLNILTISREQMYNNALHSKNCNDLEREICKFKDSAYGIISCVYIFGEGFDLPKLNGVCVAGNMQSETRIVQYLLRPNRLEFGNPNKKAYVIIPYIDTDDWETENTSFGKVRNIISEMRNVDENIEQKIVVCLGKKQIKKRKSSEDEERKSCYDEYEFEENGGELDKIKLRLRYSKALGSTFTEEQDEYNYVRSINGSLNIKSKKEYIDKKDIHSNFIASPEEYFKSKGVWNNWYDFMGVDTEKFIQTKQEWINFCKEKSMKSLDGYCMSCELYDVLPKEPADFYKDFTNIPTELGFNRNRRR